MEAGRFAPDRAHRPVVLPIHSSLILARRQRLLLREEFENLDAIGGVALGHFHRVSMPGGPVLQEFDTFFARSGNLRLPLGDLFSLCLSFLEKRSAEEEVGPPFHVAAITLAGLKEIKQEEVER